jgi:hypothetical protein
MTKASIPPQPNSPAAQIAHLAWRSFAFVCSHLFRGFDMLATPSTHLREIAHVPIADLHLSAVHRFAFVCG